MRCLRILEKYLLSLVHMVANSGNFELSTAWAGNSKENLSKSELRKLSQEKFEISRILLGIS